MVNKITLEEWINNWLSDNIRGSNQYTTSKMIIVGLGRTARLLRVRNDFHTIDGFATNRMSKAYKKSQSRLIILDNEVLFNIM